MTKNELADSLRIVRTMLRQQGQLTNHANKTLSDAIDFLERLSDGND